MNAAAIESCLPPPDGLRRQAPTLLNIVAHIDPKYGGTVSSVPPVCSALAISGRYRSAVAAFCDPGEYESVEQTYESHRFPLARWHWSRDPSLRASLNALIENASAVHVHGLWQIHCALGAALCHRLCKPLMISAHGMLDKWAIRRRRWKKALYMTICHKRHLRSAACLRALTRAEAEDYRRAGLGAPIAIIPNGVASPANPGSEEFFEKFAHLRGKTVLLFLGRLHPKKGVYLLAETWAALFRRFPQAHLVFAGPDSEGTRARLVNLIRGHDASSATTLTGLLSGSLKWSAYSAAHTFVLPSFSEGFSIAALEAMSIGCPLILSHQCHFPDVEREGCGWTIEPSRPALEAALERALGIDPSVARLIGVKGRELTATRYTWSRVSGQMADVFDWMRGGPLPASTEILFHG